MWPAVGRWGAPIYIVFGDFEFMFGTFAFDTTPMSPDHTSVRAP
jgi:hypothetical protein